MSDEPSLGGSRTPTRHRPAGRRVEATRRPSLPRWLWAPAALGIAFLALPLVGLLTRLPWTRLPSLLTTPASRDALALSLRTCTLSTVLAVLLGLPVAVVASRLAGRWAWVVRTLSVLPMVLPPVVAGLALLVTLGRRGVLGRHLAVAGVEIGFTTAAVVVAQTFVAMPFFVVALEGALRTIDPDREAVAATLGAAPGMVLRRVTLPAVAPALASGVTMTFARALGEFGATLTFAGSMQGITRTLPLETYLQREADPDAALALSAVLVGLAVVLMALPAAWMRGRR